MAARLFGKFDRCATDSPGHVGQQCGRLLSSYVATDRWGTFTPMGPSGERASAFLNPFARDIDRLRSRLRRADALSSQAASMYTTDNMWDTIVHRGTHVAEAIHGAPAGEPAGLACIRHIFHCVHELLRIEGTNLEPFQLEAIRACICSRAVRLLGEDLGKHVGSICEILGLSAANGFDPEAERRDMAKFRRYCRRFVAVVAPRRNGKSKAGKLFVAANAACEPGARIVLLAHQLKAAMLYKDDVLRHLHQLLDGHLACFKIHTAANEIRIEFRDRAPSHVYFVAGGINVSISRYSNSTSTPSTTIVEESFPSPSLSLTQSLPAVATLQSGTILASLKGFRPAMLSHSTFSLTVGFRHWTPDATEIPSRTRLRCLLPRPFRPVCTRNPQRLTTPQDVMSLLRRRKACGETRIPSSLSSMCSWRSLRLRWNLPFRAKTVSMYLKPWRRHCSLSLLSQMLVGIPHFGTNTVVHGPSFPDGEREMSGTSLATCPYLGLGTRNRSVSLEASASFFAAKSRMAQKPQSRGVHPQLVDASASLPHHGGNQCVLVWTARTEAPIPRAVTPSTIASLSTTCQDSGEEATASTRTYSLPLQQKMSSRPTRAPADSQLPLSLSHTWYQLGRKISAMSPAQSTEFLG